MVPVGSSVMLELVLAVHSYHVIAYLDLSAHAVNRLLRESRKSIKKHLMVKTFLKCNPDFKLYLD